MRRLGIANFVCLGNGLGLSVRSLLGCAVRLVTFLSDSAVFVPHIIARGTFGFTTGLGAFFPCVQYVLDYQCRSSLFLSLSFSDAKHTKAKQRRVLVCEK
jgi:hypothetical protein